MLKFTTTSRWASSSCTTIRELSRSTDLTVPRSSWASTGKPITSRPMPAISVILGKRNRLIRAHSLILEDCKLFSLGLPGSQWRSRRQGAGCLGSDRGTTEQVTSTLTRVVRSTRRVHGTGMVSGNVDLRVRSTASQVRALIVSQLMVRDRGLASAWRRTEAGIAMRTTSRASGLSSEAATAGAGGESRIPGRRERKSAREVASRDDRERADETIPPTSASGTSSSSSTDASVSRRSSRARVEGGRARRGE